MFTRQAGSKMQSFTFEKEIVLLKEKRPACWAVFAKEGISDVSSTSDSTLNVLRTQIHPGNSLAA
jgi:hypothetical protein